MNFELEETPPTFLERRVDRLERELRRHRRLTNVLCLCVTVGAIFLIAKHFDIAMPQFKSTFVSKPSASKLVGNLDFSKNQYLREDMHPAAKALLNRLVVLCQEHDAEREQFNKGVSSGKSRYFEETPRFAEFEEKRDGVLRELAEQVGAHLELDRDGKRFGFELFQYLLNEGIDPATLFNGRDESEMTR